MPKAKAAGPAIYDPQPVRVAAYASKIKIGKHYRGPDDQRWTCQFTLPNGARKRLTCGQGTDMDATFEAVRLYDRAVLMLEHGIHKPSASPKPSVPTFADAASLAVDRLTEAYEATKKAEGGKKAHKYNARRSFIRSVLLPPFGTTPWPEMAAKVREWNAGYRLPNGQKPAQSSIVNYNSALQYVNRIAVERGWLPNDPVCFPRLSRKDFRETVREPAFTDDDIDRMAKIMDDDWVEQSNTHRIFRAWVAVLASAGIRPGLEVERIRESHLEITRDCVFVTIYPRQGKYQKPRRAVCRGHAAKAFCVKYVLMDLIDWRNGNWKNSADINHAGIFTNPASGATPELHKFFRTFIKAHDLLTDINTGQEFVPYSFRHYAITNAIRDGHNLVMIARVFGTSAQMIEKHYSHIKDFEAANSMRDTKSELLAFANAVRKQQSKNAKQ